MVVVIWRGTRLVADLETVVVGAYFEERDDLAGVDLARRSQVMNVNTEPFSCGIEKRSGVNDSCLSVGSIHVDGETGQHVRLDKHVTLQQQTFVREERLVHEHTKSEREE